MERGDQSQLAEYDLAFWDIFDALVQLHKTAKLQLGPKKSKTKAWAVWLLLGMSLMLSKEAIDDAKSGRSPALWNNHRYATEVLDLIAYLNRRTTPRQFAVDWFDRVAIKAPRPRQEPRNSRERRELREEADNFEAYKNELGRYAWTYSSTLNGFLSQQNMHPSYASVRFSFFYSQHAGSLDMYDLSRGRTTRLDYARPIDYLNLSLLGFLNSRIVLKYPSDPLPQLESLVLKIGQLRRTTASWIDEDL